jgi:hypothetical protein
MSTETKIIELSEERELRARIEAEFNRLFGADVTEQRKLLERIIEIKTQLAEDKVKFVALTDEYDEIALALHAGGFRQLDLTAERIELVDNYAVKNRVFRPAAVPRFEIAIEGHEKRQKREARKEKKNG